MGRLVTILLMLTGGSPGSTAGGFKTTTLAVLLLSAWAVFRRRSSAECFGRRLPEAVAAQCQCHLLALPDPLFLGGALICCIDGVALLDALFESASAIGTVGLSIVGTANLSAPSRLILIFLMYFGRVGGLDHDLRCDSGHVESVVSISPGIGDRGIRKEAFHEKSLYC